MQMFFIETDTQICIIPDPAQSETCKYNATNYLGFWSLKTETFLQKP